MLGMWGDNLPKRIIRLRHKLVHALDFPCEAAEGTVRLQMLGREEMTVENHKGVYEYKADLVRLQTREGMLRITGEKLMLRELSLDRIYISGVISGFFYEISH